MSEVHPLEIARRLAEEFAQTAAERDARGGTAWQERKKLRESGLLRLVIPKHLGGIGADWPTTLQAVRIIATADGALAHVFGYHFLELVVPHLIGSRNQREYYYEQTALQNWFWGNAFNPPVVSSIDPTKITGWKVVITPDGNDFRISGTNIYCSGATGSDVLVISALRPGIERLADAFVAGVVPTTREGIVIHDDWDSIGQRQTDSGSVTFENVLVNIVRHFGELLVDLEAARVLTDRAARSLDEAWKMEGNLTPDQRAAVAIEIALAKVAATRAGLRISSEMFELMGARATKAKDRFDRFWRNLRTHTLHDPVDYKIRDLGLWALKDEPPKPGFYS